MKSIKTLISTFAGLAGCAMLLGVALPAQAAEDCPFRGTLDKQYCDRDRDLVADLPTNPSDWVNPNTIIFAYTPVEDPAVYQKAWADFLKHMEKVTGKKVVFFSVQSNAAQLEAMRSGRLHIAGFNTGSNPIAVSCAGFVPFATMADKGKIVGYEMEIIVPADSDIKTPADIKGRSMAFTSPTSNSGFKAPSALLKTEFGIEPDKDFKAAFSGKHDNSILGVANKDYEAASIANSVLFRMLERGVVKQDQIRTIYRSQTFPTTGYGLAHNLHPELVAKIEQAFFTFDWKGTTLEEEFGRQADGFVRIVHKFDWDVIRKIDTTNGVSYDCK